MQYSINTTKARTNSFATEGGVLTTELYLAADPSQSLEAATKRYVDSKILTIAAASVTSGTMPIARFPGYDGDISNTAGSNVLNLKNSGVTAGAYPKVTVTTKGIVTQGAPLTSDDIPNLTWSKVSIDRPTTLSGFGISNALSKSGGVMTGFISAMNAPTQTLHAANKSYVDNFSISGGSGVATGTIERLPQTTTPTGYLRCNGALVSKTTYPALYAAVGDTFSSQATTTPGSGKPWCQQYAFNTTQSSDITGWSTGPSLPGTLAESQAIVTQNRVYLLGGRDADYTYLSTVYTAPINSDGTLGTWTTGTSLPGVLAFSQAIVTKNRVYLLGGTDGTSPLSTVYTAPINGDGTLGAWTTGTSLPDALDSSQAIVTQNRVYLLGGLSASEPVATVYTAPINGDGTLGAWSTGTSLPGGLGNSQAIVTRNRVYLLGGWTTDAVATVYTAPINSDGTLGAWTTGTSLPDVLDSSQAIVTQNRVYLLGGWATVIDSVATVYTAPINSDGTLGAWSTGTSLPDVLSYSQAIVTQNRVYLLGGWKGDSVEATVYTASFSGGLNDYSTFYTTGYVAADPDNFQLPDYSSLESSDFKYYIKY